MPTNELVHEKSPYLRQHADNPVAWLPWGEAAFARARQEGKPIFLSIGYSTCHWCHVMAHESFEDEATAEVLNRSFVPIKLDREERPDVDRIYMLFVQATTGSGGWPMSVFLTPQLKPFFGGTYFPPRSAYGRPGFRDLLVHLEKAWRHDRAQIEEASMSVTAQLESMATGTGGSQLLNRELFTAGYWQLRRSFDERYGGFGSAPKFPRPIALNYLLRYYAAENSEEALDMVTRTLEAMAAGGMHDQLGGGFHRYSVDEHWFVPHFEKMLYDQAQLAVAYVEAFQITGRPLFARVARGICDYVLRDMTDADGGFYSAEDADSADPEDPAKHGEGAFYIWRASEIETLLGGKQGNEFCRFYGVEQDGNVENDPHGEFTGRNILYEARGEAGYENLGGARQTLFAVRDRRPRPHLDNKILTAWNGLMISALARGAGVLEEPRYLEAAKRAAGFLSTRMYDEASGQLLRRYCDGEAAVEAFADDYAFFAQGLIDLFEATGRVEYLKAAEDLLGRGLSRFEDKEGGGFFSTAGSASDILLRLKDDYDGAEPSANSIAAEVLLRVSHLTGNKLLADQAERVLEWFGPKLKSQPTVAPQAAVALGRWLTAPEHVVVRCQTLDEKALGLLRTKQRAFAPNASVFTLSDEAALYFRDTSSFLGGLDRQGSMTLYECRDFTCQLPQVFP